MRPRILVANRDPDAQDIFCAALRHAGYEAHALSEPDRVLHEAPGCALVITDYPVTVHHASTITRMLRENAATAAIPILNATTHALPHELEAARSAGVSESIVLPTRLEVILEKVHAMVAEARGS